MAPRVKNIGEWSLRSCMYIVSPYLCIDLTVDVPGYGKVVLDIGYGGAFYAFLSAEKLGLDVCSSSVRDLVDAATAVTEAVKKQVQSHAFLP